MSSFTRRKFLEVVAVAASATALTGCPTGNKDEKNRPIEFAPEFFPQSVASGDPRTANGSSSIILWTRLQLVAGDHFDHPLTVQVASDESFQNIVVSQSFVTKHDNDNCLKVRVTKLQPDTTYWYRFIVATSDKSYRSRPGRTKTAPEASNPREVKFASVSCQDYIGRFYNPYVHLAQLDLDFIIHLGDYIYETNGDPRFQVGNPLRKVTFSEPGGAITISGTDPVTHVDYSFLSAQSLSNYRDLYKTYRTDVALQSVHEKFPFICIWDDHEFSDDSWQDTATSFNGRQPEENIVRKHNAETAYFDYMPVDNIRTDVTEAMEVDDNQLFPHASIYRDFRYGKNVHLAMTDYRSFRPDHLIPEDAFPGSIAIDQAGLISIFGDAVFGAIKGKFSPYFNFAEEPWKSLFAPYITPLHDGIFASYQAELHSDEAAAARTDAIMNSNVGADVINALLAKAHAPLLPAEALAMMPRGLDFSLMGKTSLFSELGSRYFVVKDTYNLWAGFLEANPEHPLAAQNAYGVEQDTWLTNTLGATTATWKFLGSSTSWTSMILDLTSPALGVPPPYNQKFLLNVDQWDAFPNQRDIYKAKLKALGGAIILSGDIHANFATDHSDGIIEFTGTSVSSGTQRALLKSAVAGSDLKALPGVDLLVAASDSLMKQANANIKYVNGAVNGVTVITVGKGDVVTGSMPDGTPITEKDDYVDVSFYEWSEKATFTNSYASPLGISRSATEIKFLVRAADKTLIVGRHHMDPIPPSP